VAAVGGLVRDARVDSRDGVVEVSLSGDRLTLPYGGPPEDAALVRETLQQLAVALHPLYGAIDVDRPIPGPEELEGRRIGPDLYLSERLLDVDAHLEADLRNMFPGVVVERWPGGRFLAGWEVLGGGAAPTLAAAEQAASRLAKAVRATRARRAT
jgi:hypothetical protein